MSEPFHTVGIFAPSSWVEKSDIEDSQRFIEEQGFGTFVHPQTYARHNQSAGTHKEKLNAFYDLWDNPEIDIIWTAGGGNRCLHWIDDIDYERLTEHKPVIGFSDSTALLNALYAHKKITTYHGPTFNRLHRTPQATELLQLLKGEDTEYAFENSTVLNPGEAKGPMVGGNLSVFQYLPQTLPGDFWNGAILFLEDWNEELSRLDRMLLHLRRLGVFQNVSGILFGDFGKIPETGRPFGYTLEDIIREHTRELSIPIACSLPFGHGKTLHSFPIGRPVTATMSSGLVSLKI